MHINTEITDNHKKEKTTPIPVWNDYNHYHDYLINLLSYGRKDNFSESNVWEFEYV